MDYQRRKYRLPSGTVISVSIVNLSTVQENWVPLDETKPPAPTTATQTVEAEKKPAPARKRTSRKPAAK